MSTAVNGLDGVEQIPEEIGDVIESNDHSTRRLAPPGKYTSLAREIVASEKVSLAGQGYLSFAIRLVGGITDAAGNRFNDGQYPLRAWVNTLAFKKRDFVTQQEYPGTTSTAAEYVKATGASAKGLTVEAAKELILQSVGTPVGVRIGRTERSRKNADGSYAKRLTYTKHWNKGTKDAPIWAAEIDIDGITLLATESVEGFFKL